MAGIEKGILETSDRTISIYNNGFGQVECEWCLIVIILLFCLKKGGQSLDQILLGLFGLPGQAVCLHLDLLPGYIFGSKKRQITEVLEWSSF